jgi:hypothetical protein
VTTFTFASGSALILAMRSILTPHTRLRAQAYLILRAVECLTIVAIGG